MEIESKRKDQNPISTSLQALIDLIGKKEPTVINAQLAKLLDTHLSKGVNKVNQEIAGDILRQLRRILFFLEKEVNDRTIFQKATNFVIQVNRLFFHFNQLKIFRDFRIQHAYYHSAGSLTCGEVSKDGRYFATGT